jgi:hypothetical protein
MSEELEPERELPPMSASTLAEIELGRKLVAQNQKLQEEARAVAARGEPAPAPKVVEPVDPEAHKKGVITDEEALQIAKVAAAAKAHVEKTAKNKKRPTVVVSDEPVDFDVLKD